MDAASILVLILCAGVVALLVWFEVNSRRNGPRKVPTPLEQRDQPSGHKENETADSGKQKAA